MVNLSLAFILVWTSLAIAAKLPGTPDNLEIMEKTERLVANDRDGDDDDTKIHFVAPPGNSTDDDSTDRIIGGARIPSAKTFPFAARIEIHRRGGFLEWITGNSKVGLCGGTIISSNWVLTAAHCIVEKDSDDDPKMDIVSVYVRAGSVDPWRGGQYVKAARLYPHGNYAGFDEGGAYDIGLIQLSRKLPLGATIHPALVMGKNFVPPLGWRLYVAGWGRTIAGDVTSASPILKAASVVVHRCPYELENAPSPDATFCAWGTSGANGDADLTKPSRHCKGDSGGFVGYYSSTYNNYVVVGVVSGSGPRNTCYNNRITSVSHFNGFIDG